jgi:hypothetical protein
MHYEATYSSLLAVTRICGIDRRRRDHLVARNGGTIAFTWPKDLMSPADTSEEAFR